MPRKKTRFEFEQALGDLQQVVEQLEGGELSLEQALTQFERGINLSRACQAALNEAEHKINTLLEHSVSTTKTETSP